MGWYLVASRSSSLRYAMFEVKCGGWKENVIDSGLIFSLAFLSTGLASANFDTRDGFSFSGTTSFATRRI